MLTNLKDEFKVKHYSTTKEIGGLIIGRWIVAGEKQAGVENMNKWYLRKLLSFKNRSQTPETDYKLPGGIILILKCLPYILMGYYVIGTWHTHPNGRLKPSEQDEAQAKLFFARNSLLKVDRFILGIGAEDLSIEGKKYFKLQPYLYFGGKKHG